MRIKRMKRLFFILTLCALLAPLVTQAQSPLYRQAKDSLTATGVTTTAKATAGFDTYKYVNCTESNPAYELEAIQLKFTKTTDSVGIQGLTIDYGKDSIWTQVPIKVKFIRTSLSTPQYGILLGDTVIAKWITPNYTAGHTGATPIIDLSGQPFTYYRVVSGLNDTGKTYIMPIRKLRK
jgi:hypothetical protein